VADEIGSVAVEVRADLGPLTADFAKGEQQTRQWAAATQANANKATRSLTTVGAAGSTALNSLRIAGEKAAQSASLITGPLGGVASRISILSNVQSGANLALLAGSAAFAGLAFGIAAAVRESEKFTQLQRRTEAVLRATGNAAGLTANDIRELADELDRTTLADPAEVEQASQMLLTFKSVVGNTFREAIKLSVDLAEVGFGSVTSGAVQLGKALEDPTNGIAALRRVGVSFTATQKEQIKNFQESGQLAKAQAVVLKALRDQVGGAAAGSAGGLTGAIDDLSDSYDRLLRRLGNSGPINEAISGLARLGSAALDAVGKMFAATEAERFSALSEQIATMRANLRRNNPKSPGYDDYQRRIARLEEERNKLGEQIQQTESLLALDQQRTQEASARVQAEAEAERAAEVEKSLAGERLENTKAAADNELSVTRAKLDTEAAMNEAAYAKGAKDIGSYYAERKRIAEAGVNAEVAALEKQRDAVAGSSVDGKEAEMARDREVAALTTQIAVKKQELTTATYDLAAAQSTEAASTKDVIAEAQRSLAIMQQLAAIYDGTVESEREMATQEKILNALAAEGIAANSEKGKALAELVRQTEELNNATQDRIRLEQSLQGVRDEIQGIKDQDAASLMPRGEGAAFLKEQELLRGATASGASVTAAQRQEIEALARAYGQATAASEQLRAAQAAQNQFAQSVVDTTSNLVEGLVTDIDNWKEHLLNAFGDVLQSFIRMLGQMAIANAASGATGSGSGGWLGKLLGFLIGAAGSAAGSAFSGGASAGSSFTGASGNVYNTGFDASKLTLNYHRGGRVGRDGSTPRSFPTSTFINADKYHGGGRVRPRLGPREVPAILEEGETVLPRGFKAGRGGTTNIWNITTPDPNAFMASQRQIQRKAKMRMGMQARMN
jgi:hypothetical protein